MEDVGVVDRKQLITPHGIYQNEHFREIFRRLLSLSLVH